MPLVAESAWHVWNFNPDDDFSSVTFDLDFPPTLAFIKVVLGHFFPFGGDPVADIGLLNIRHRMPDNSDQTLTFPDIDDWSPVYVLFDPTMTHVTMGISLRACSASLVWTMGTWA